jgi:glycerol-3-phosphate responsive antiterminator
LSPNVESRNQLVFFIDHCLQCDHVVDALRECGAEVRLHLDHFRGDEEDSVWISEVSSRDWVILTKDKMIRRRPLEKQALLAANARAFILTAGEMKGSEVADLLAKRFTKIMRLAKNTPRPFVAKVTKSNVDLLECH